MSPIHVGVLALQGAVSEHADILKALGAEVTAVRKPEHLERLDALIIPGGESTAIARLAAPFNLLPHIRKQIVEKQLAVLGTCAGLILLADRVNNEGALAGFDRVTGLDITVDRNAYGSQLDSFEADVEYVLPTSGSGEAGSQRTGQVAFIRAPRITAVGQAAVPVAWHDGEVVAIEQDRLIGATFHPEITGANFLHERLLELAE